MEFVHGEHYLINYYTNVLDFRINIYNKLNNKKYEIIESELVTKYKEIGIDIFEIIKYCFDEEDYELDDKHTFILIKFNYKNFIKFNLHCGNLLCEPKELSILELKTENLKMKDTVKELRTKINNMEERIDKMKEKEYIKILEYKVHKDTTKLYLCDYIHHNNINRYGLSTSILPPVTTYHNCNTIGIRSSFGNYNGFARSVISIQHDSCHDSCPIIPSPNESYYNPNDPENFADHARLIFIKNTDNVRGLNILSNVKEIGFFNITINADTKMAVLLSTIKKLYMDNVKIENFGAKRFFSSMDKLEELGVVNCKFITDDHVCYLNKLPLLKKVFIQYSGIVNKSLFRAGIEIISA